MNPRVMRRAWPALLLIAAGAIGAYALYAQEGIRAVTAKATPAPAPARGLIPASHPRIPASHPPISKAPPGADARVGTVTVDPTRAFTHFRVGNNSVTAIYADGPVMWLGTSGGMVRFDTLSREFKTYDARDGLQSNGILYLGKLKGKISVGTYGGGLSLLNQDAQEWEHYGIAEGLANVFVYDVLEASSTDVWIATGAGVNRVRGGALKERAKWDLYTVASTGGGLPHDRVQRIAEGKDGSVWFATRGGVARFRNGKWENWTHAKGLGAARKGTSRGVAIKGDRTLGQAQEKEQAHDARGAGANAALNPNHVAALAVGEDGRVWAGTWGAGLARFDGKAWRNYTVAEGLANNQISTLNFDRKGQLWIGTRDGLSVFSNGKFQVMTTAHGLLAENVYSVTTTKDGGVWVGSFGGVAHIRQPALNNGIHLPPAPIDASMTASPSS